MSVILINSNRVSDKTSDVEIEHNLHKRIYSVGAVSLDFAQIPYSFKILNSKNNKFRIEYSGQSYEADIPVGNYDNETTFMTAVQTALNQNGGLASLHYTLSKTSEDKIQIQVKTSASGTAVEFVNFLWIDMSRLAIMLGYDQTQNLQSNVGGIVNAPYEMNLTGGAMLQLETTFPIQSQLSGSNNRGVFLIPINTTANGFIMYQNSFPNNKVYFNSVQDVTRIKYRITMADNAELIGGGDLQNIPHFVQFTCYV